MRLPVLAAVLTPTTLGCGGGPAKPTVPQHENAARFVQTWQEKPFNKVTVATLRGLVPIGEPRPRFQEAIAHAAESAQKEGKTYYMFVGRRGPPQDEDIRLAVVVDDATDTIADALISKRPRP